MDQPDHLKPGQVLRLAASGTPVMSNAVIEGSEFDQTDCDQFG